MQFDPPLEGGILRRRYQRFLADVRLDSGAEVTAHCPNTGKMTGCAEPGSRVWLSRSANPRRKYAHTWELVETAQGHLAGVNTARANVLVEEAIAAGVITELQGYAQRRRETVYAGGRIDWLLSGDEGRSCYLEVKSVTLLAQNPVEQAQGVGLFPDAVSVRGTRQLMALAELACAGQRAAVCYCVQHSGLREVRPAAQIDPAYAEALGYAAAAGVELLAYAARLSVQGVVLYQKLPVKLGAAHKYG